MNPSYPWPVFNDSDAPLECLVKLSRFYGGDPGFVLAGGGNTSVKIDDRLYIKASGVALAAIDPGGFVALRLGATADIVNQPLAEAVSEREQQFQQAVMAGRLEPEKGQRPSVESVLHALAPGDFVVHSHCTLVNMITCCRNGRQLADELFGDEILWLDYVDPGFVLACSFARELADWQARTGRVRPRAIFMQNHGLMVSGDEPGLIKADTDWVIDVIERHMASVAGGAAFGPVDSMDEESAARIRGILEPVVADVCGEKGQSQAVCFDGSREVMEQVSGREGLSAAQGGPLSPDQIVYCKSFALWLSVEASATEEAITRKAADAAAKYREQWGYSPRVVLAEGVGLFGVGETPEGASTAAQVYRDAIMVMAGANRLGGIRHLPRRDREFIDNWEVEAYRRSVASKG